MNRDLLVNASPRSGNAAFWRRVAISIAGLAALVWFLIRVIPKPGRASYPCQRAAFPIASAFVVWLVGSISGLFAAVRLHRLVRRYRWAAVGVGLAAFLLLGFWISEPVASSAAVEAVNFHYAPEQRNTPLGAARGINLGRVVWAHDPSATRWAGTWKTNSDPWWSDANTDQEKVGAMLSACMRKLTSMTTDTDAWRAIFRYYNARARHLDGRGYRAGETVAIKANFNNANNQKISNLIDVSPQMVLAMVHQLVNEAHVAPGDILVYDARRSIPAAVLTKVWGEFKDVRFVQEAGPNARQPKNPAYGDYHGLEAADWVEGVTYSKGEYKDAKLIPRQVLAATYLVNMALIKAHSYPWNFMEGGEYAELGDMGQTAVTMTGKNHFGSIKGTREHHDSIDTNKKAAKNAYSPIVDLAASPNLGAKTILFVLDGLYCGRKHASFPLHFPNAPFNNRVTPYENPAWPASVLASLDGVALDSVGLDILYSQSLNNGDPKDQDRPRILIRENADDYLREMAQAEKAPSGTAYVQNGARVTSLGVFEHWDSDATRRYSRNKDRARGAGIELFYLPMGAAPTATPEISLANGPKGARTMSIRCVTPGARIYYTADGSNPTDHSPIYDKPVVVGVPAKIQAIAMSDDLRDSAVASR